MNHLATVPIVGRARMENLIQIKSAGERRVDRTDSSQKYRFLNRVRLFRIRKRPRDRQAHRRRANMRAAH